jgi:1-deoxy-D-xylulose-5-phosphate reductoisomerase
LSAANEIAVGAFLEGQISWSKIAGVIEQTMQHHDGVLPTTVEDILNADESARRFAALELTK